MLRLVEFTDAHACSFQRPEDEASAPLFSFREVTRTFAVIGRLPEQHQEVQKLNGLGRILGQTGDVFCPKVTSTDKTVHKQKTGERVPKMKIPARKQGILAGFRTERQGFEPWEGYPDSGILDRFEFRRNIKRG